MPILNQYVGFLLNKSKISFYHTSNNSIPSPKHVPLRLLDMSCNSYRANYFRLFFYAAAFSVAHEMKHTLFKDTVVEGFTMDSFIKRVMLSAVYIVEKKTFIRISFSPHHRHLEELTMALARLAA
jgi:hypothetical protein